MSERLKELMDGKQPQEKKKPLWLYLAVPAVLIALVGFNYAKGFIGEKKAEKAITAYVQETYGNQLDKFEHSMGTHKQINGILSKTIGYHLYFYEQELWGGGFTINTDLGGNIIYDGYKNWYLTGGTVFEHYNGLYMGKNSELKAQIYNKAIQEKFFTGTDEFGVHNQLRGQRKAADGGYGEIMIAPQLDHENEYNLDELAKNYGETFIYLKSDRYTQQDFADYVKYCRNYLQNSHWPYQKAIIFLRPANTKDFLYYSATFTAEEINSGKSGSLIGERTVQYTQDMKQADAEIIAGGGDWPQNYTNEFNAVTSFEIF